MAYESFYGGRRGISFVIVARFDGVDIPQVAGSYVYKRKSYAYKTFDGDNTKYFIYPFIERTYKTYQVDTYKWEQVELNGGNVMTVDESATSPVGAISRSTGDPQLAEGMVQCFSQGGATTDKVNYGEYVIIDSIEGRNDYNCPDNGKVYRRGMDYIVTPENPLAGAEYIGRIVGPQGDITKLIPNGFNEVEAIPGSQVVNYYYTDGLVPGKVDDTTFNDDIKTVYATLKDAEGNITECQIGFEFPYLVEEFIARSISPYGDDDHILPADYELSTRIDDETHPFFEKWRLDIPKGIHGDDISGWHFEPTMGRPGSEYWLQDADMGVEPADGTLDAAYPIIAINPNYLTVDMNDISVYIYPSSGWKYAVKYNAINYDNIKTGESTVITDDLSNYDVLNKIELKPDGTVLAHYTNRNSEPLDNQVQWIYDVGIDTDGNGAVPEEGAGDQRIHYTYNTDTMTTTAIGRPLNYIIDSVVTDYDATKNPDNIPMYRMLVYYSDPARRTSTISYYSEKLGKVVTGWTDMGYVRGPVEGLRIIGEVNDITDLQDQETGEWLKPEEIVSDPGLAEKMQGWAVTDAAHYIWVYDYKVDSSTVQPWYSIGNIDASLVDVSKIFYIGATQPTGTGDHAVWGQTFQVKYAD